MEEDFECKLNYHNRFSLRKGNEQSYTGNSSDVRQLRCLQKKGYTSYAPQYEGHAAPPEEILKSSPCMV